MKKLILSSAILLSCVAAFSQIQISKVKSKEELLNEKYCSGLFKTPDGTYFDLLNDDATLSVKGYFNVLHWLEGRVAGLQVYVSRTSAHIPYIRNSRAGIYVDEMQVGPEYLNSLSVHDIAMIKVIKGPFAGGFNSPGGVIAIYTIQGEDEEESD
jgi:hypothetical protein